ncbi:nodulation protein NfeD [Sulfurospirillum sp. T05]|uniref:Nodulation protein NfeD n=1 Tax=Sulfurospirillum tamanense TaxID=2813362 RepID=A0ABS2WUL2_9BACT|nr:nodulation protein NfeD [Sulfurospirillum tamanensis]MBN2965351.1 nodulation protein NfeD [Sulfurospirillum tamanensis]
MRHLFWLLFFVTISVASSVLHVSVQGAISPASVAHLQHAFSHANTTQASLMIIELDTPGGLLESTREMVQEITNAPLPVVVYVSPKGARAASAGTYLLYASHVAAMAPGTNVGAATPVSIGASQDAPPSTMEKKVLEDANAYLQSLAELRGRNSEWAQKAVKEGASISANTALELGVIDLVAEDIPTLLAVIHGTSVQLNATTTLTLDTADVLLERLEPDFKTAFLSVISNPTFAYLLMLLALYGIFFELLNPGAILPGVVGLISGLLALYAFNLLPFNYAGLALIGLGVALMIGEVFVAGFGIFGIAGIIAFSLGSVFLFDAQTLGNDISIPLIVAVALVSVAFFVYVTQMALSARSIKATTGTETLIGQEAKVVKITDDGYLVESHGELWTGKSHEPLILHQRVEITGFKGLKLTLKSIHLKE